MKKYLSCLLVLLALVLPGLVMEADAATIVDSGSCGENVTWTLDSEGTLTISGTGDMEDYGWENVPWLYQWESIRHIVVEKGVTHIGSRAFGHPNLISITLPDGVISIGDYAFCDCFILSSITIPDSVTRIGDSAFAYCYSLSNITLPDGVARIGDGAFYGCESLSAITIPGSVTRIGDYAFHNCTSLSSITIPNSVISIGDYAFLGCDDLSSITLSDSVTSIGYGAFSGCTSLSSITIPGSVTSIGEHAFPGCRSLSGIWVNGENQFYSSDDRGVLFDKDKSLLIKAPGAISGVYSIPDSVTDIGDSAFSDCTRLSNITIPNSITGIGRSVFGGCTGLSSITIPDSVTYIGEYAFDDCYNLSVVHYGGTEAQRENMEIGDHNWDLEDAVWHYECSEGNCPNPFVDIATSAYYYDPVLWAIDNGITNGLDAIRFGPEATCTRGQIVTFLWRANGSPEPESSTNPFGDVMQNDYFYKAVLWAVENGITSGMGDGSFAPNAPCTRGQVATFLWRACGQPAPSGTNIFTDIAPGAYYYDAVLWAVENGITNGMGDGTFAPDAPCTRGQIVTFLYRAMA